MISQNLWWTSIWDALLSAKNLFREKDREKVVILLTDWESNQWVNPLASALALEEENIKVYTIWVWSKEWWYINYKIWSFTRKEYVPPLNDKTLKEIARLTKAKYFRASDDAEFKRIFESLEALEKSDIEVEVKKNYKEKYQFLAYLLSFLIFCFILVKLN